MRIEDTRLLVCPSCRGALAYQGTHRGGRIARGHLGCAHCGARWPVEDGLARMYREAEVKGSDRFMRRIYDGLPFLHDPMVRYTLPIFQAGTEKELREAWVRLLELDRLEPRADGRPLRLLEVGVGTGANLSYFRRAIPRGLDVQIWGLDLSAGMLGVLRRRARHERDGEIRLLMADAHALPFADGTFDRVFHVGGINGFRDPRTALAELARVAVSGSPIVVGDEQLDPHGRKSLYHRILFRLVTFYDEDPRCPTELLPSGSTDVLAEQASMFFYGLRFRMPAAPAR